MKIIISRLYFLLLILFIAPTIQAQDLLPKPVPARQVVDAAGVMSQDQISNLERILDEFDKSTSNQIVVVTIPTLNDYPIEEYANKLFRSWGIGNKSTNNGILIIAAINDRKLRIEVGYGLEGAIPDITANHIIENDLKPNFRQKQYFEGFEAAANSIIKAAAGEYTVPEDYRKKENTDGWGKIIPIIIIIIIFSLLKGRGGRGGHGFSPPVFWTGGGGGFSSGNSDSGGGFDFGGGSSGGGGASGDW